MIGPGRYLIGLVSMALVGCTALEPGPPPASQVLDGPLAGLTSDQSLRHARGDAAFNNQVFTTATGLGPLFVATSCGSCHAGDGKGHPFTTLTRFGQSDTTGNSFLNQGGPQLQNRAVPGYNPETIPAGATFTKLMPPANTGLGYLELVPEADILAMADPNDANHDGISGRANYNSIPYFVAEFGDARPKNGKYVCRFGKKAGAYSLMHQTVNAYNQDIGITSEYEPIDPHSGLPTDPEVSTQTINDVVFYLQTLKAPIPRNASNADVIHGKEMFLTIGCERCHRQTLSTGHSQIAALSFQTFHPYTDLLLHDMGGGLDDGYTEGTAMTSEWRTPPLWGIGLAPNSQGGQYYLLHDGRARSLDEAIRLHGGEGAASTSAYSQLSESDRAALIRFLQSL